MNEIRATNTVHTFNKTSLRDRSFFGDKESLWRGDIRRIPKEVLKTIETGRVWVFKVL